MEDLSSGVIPAKLANRFRVVRILGSGGLSSVYLVEDHLSNGAYRALKILKDNKLDPENLIRFKEEFAVLEKIEHPNLIKAYELVEINNSIGYLMEVVVGSNLLEVVRNKKLEYLEIELIFSSVLSALFELHNNKLAHRDIKLENVLIGEDGSVKLSDLGLMKRTDTSDNSETGVLLGTSQYLPPEYVKHSVYNFRSDLYAVGLMLYECLAGKRWLEGKNGQVAIDYLREMKFEFPKLALAGLPHKYQRILEIALASQPWKRFADAEAMRLALLSETGDASSSEAVQVSENICIRSAHERRKTSEFLSRRGKRKRVARGLIGFLGAIALTTLAGVATSFSSPFDIEDTLTSQQQK